MDAVALNTSAWLPFSTCNPATGAAQDASSTPTATVHENGVAMGYSPTVTNTGTGRYLAQVDATTANGFEAGKRYAVFVSATVAGVSGADGAGEFEVLSVSMNSGIGSIPAMATRLILVEKILRNKMITDPITGIMMLYDDDGTTVLLSGPIFEDAAATQPYRDKGADRRERLA
jgi:hypothetical protein